MSKSSVIQHAIWFLRERAFERGDVTIGEAVAGDLSADMDKALSLLESDESDQRIVIELRKLFGVRRG